MKGLRTPQADKQNLWWLATGKFSQYLDICSWQVVLCHYVFRKIDVVRQRHATSMDVENSAFGFLVGKGKLDFSVDTACASERETMSDDRDPRVVSYPGFPFLLSMT